MVDLLRIESLIQPIFRPVVAGQGQIKFVVLVCYVIRLGGTAVCRAL